MTSSYSSKDSSEIVNERILRDPAQYSHFKSVSFDSFENGKPNEVFFFSFFLWNSREARKKYQMNDELWVK